MARKKLPEYTKVGDRVTTLLRSDAERVLQVLYAADFTGDDDELNVARNREECLQLIELLEREIHRYDEKKVR